MDSRTEGLGLTRIIQTVAYHAKLRAQVKERVDSLAAKMGVDPDRDFLLIPRAWCKVYGLNEKDFPPWIKASSYAKKAEIVKGVRGEHG